MHLHLINDISRTDTFEFGSYHVTKKQLDPTHLELHNNSDVTRTSAFLAEQRQMVSRLASKQSSIRTGNLVGGRKRDPGTEVDAQVIF